MEAWLPRYDAREVHSVVVRAPAAAVFRALREVTLAEMPLAAALLWLRSLPLRLAAGRPAGRAETGPIVAGLVSGGFIPLAEEPNRAVVLGVVGRFWRLGERPRRDIVAATAFRAFDEPGWAKAAVSFTVDPLPGGGGRLRTETRVLATDPAARRAFRRYWRVVRFGSALIRRLWLGAIKRRAERDAGGTANRAVVGPAERP